DLYLTNYCDFQLADHRTCAEQGVEVYCGPEEFKGVADRLFRNQGDGTFQDLTQQAGLHNPIGKGMSAIWSDYDNDGDPDLFVANDGTENFLYQNNNDGTFQDLAWLAGVDCDDHGNMQGSMGLDLADYDNDGYPDLLVTNFQRQLNTLYRNEGNGFFNDISFPSGLGYSLPFVSWGTGFFDFNNDGFLDLFIVNGHIQDQIERYDSSTTYLQADHLLLNDQQNSFDRQPPLLTPPKAGRGAAFGDYDNDGDIDILVNNAHDVPTLWRNDTKSMHHWLMVKLVGQNGNRYGIGAKTKVITPAQTWSAECRAGASYMSTNDSRLHFGLGQTRSIELVEVHWPSGLIDRIKSPLINSILVVVEGSTQE
ncbi:MAG: CRTAC1 family protein, partial [Candidatus Poribacteria bacterium]|nr:CRTAC1 family protein [Candidatus Poribacteria bacterium]